MAASSSRVAVGVEPLDVDPLHLAAPFQLGQPRQERMAAMQFVRSEGHDQEDAIGPQLTDEERDRLPRRGVGPVEVLDDEEDGFDLGKPLQHAEDRVEQSGLERFGLGPESVPSDARDGTSLARSPREVPMTVSRAAGSSFRASARSASTIGPYGIPPSPTSAHPPIRTRTPRSVATTGASATSRDLPTPASPATS